MFNFSDYFNEEYQYALKSIRYDFIENDLDDKINLNCKDVLSAKIDDHKLMVEICRKVFFLPEAIFDLSVTASVILEFKSDLDDKKMNEVDWENALIASENSFLSNVLCRTSGIISAITASYGHQPVITPPNFITE